MSKINLPKDSVLLVLKKEEQKSKGLTNSTKVQNNQRGEIVQSNHPDYKKGIIHFSFAEAVNFSESHLNEFFPKNSKNDFVLVKDEYILLNIIN